MNSDKQSSLNKSATMSNNMDLIFNCVFKGYVAVISYDNEFFCKLAFGKKFLGAPDVYYHFDDFKFIGSNAIRGFFDKYTESIKNGEPEYHMEQYSFQEIEGYCKLYYAFEPEDDKNKALASLKTPTVINIHEVKKTGELIYLINNVIYSEHFPLEWALTAKHIDFTDEHGKQQTCIAGPGTSPLHCRNCNIHGSFKGVFIGYCCNCATDYNFTRGYGYECHGVETSIHMAGPSIQGASETYLLGVDLDKLGYSDICSDVCLSGGSLPTGKDICDDQSDVDPFNEYENDDDLYVTNSNGSKTSSMRPSKIHPRRAYGMLRNGISMFQHTHTDEMTPDFIRRKIEEFLSANNFEVTDNNYSFPIGKREEWDHYRLEKTPSYWYAWNTILKEQNMKFDFRLYMSNPIVNGNGFYPVTLLLCCCFQGDSNSCYKTIAEMNDWIFDRKKHPVIGNNDHVPSLPRDILNCGILPTSLELYLSDDEDDKYEKYADSDKGYDEAFDDSEEYGNEYDDFNGLITKKIV